MSTSGPQRRRAHFVDPDPTARDLTPWHLPALDDEPAGVEEVTGILPVPAAARALAVVPVPGAGPGRRLSESVEHLSLPHGLFESMLPLGVRPRGAVQVRIAIVRLVRELGADYRRRRGCALRTDAVAIETVQRRLLDHASDALAGRVEARSLAPELVRHGMLLGEILARRADGVWVDLEGPQPALWKVAFPSGVAVCPVGRVHRFLLEQHREEDLVALYLEREAAAERRG